MRKLLRGLAGAMLVLGVLGVPPAAAQEDGDGSVLLILDASGSMNRVDDEGVVLIEGAQEALTRLVEVLPPGVPVGLRVYGHRVPNTDKANGCLDTELIVPVEPLDPPAMIDAINSFGAKGFTPIGLSLQEAAADLPGGHGTIVLVSDGEDTCAPPDPCDVASELITQGIDVRVHTVGFFLEGNEAARVQLQCIANETGGTFREVTSVDTLAAELGSIVKVALPSVGRVHLPIRGALDIALAPMLPLVPPFEGGADGFFAEGAYVSSMLPGETRWYAVELAEGQGLIVYGGGNELVPVPLPGEAIEITILDEHLNDVRREAPRFGTPRVDASEIGPYGPSVAAVTFTDFDPWELIEPEGQRNARYQGYDEDTYHAATLRARLAPREALQPAGTYYVGITWHSNRRPVELDVTFGLSVWTLAPRLGSDYLLANGSTNAATATLLDAPLFDLFKLPPGEYPLRRGFYVGTINSGETRWYRHGVERDEAVAVEATLVRAPDLTRNEGRFAIQIYDPALAKIGREYMTAMQAAIDDSSPSPGVGATMAFSGEGGAPPTFEGEVYLAVTWTSPLDETAQVRLIVDVMDRYPQGVAPPSGIAVAPTTETTDTTSAAAVTEEARGDPLFIVILVGAAIVTGTGLLALTWRRSHRSSG